MNYIYDLYLNFNKVLYDFFDWNKKDKLTYLKIIPLIKISEENFKKIVSYNMKIDESFLNSICNKSIIKNKYYILFADNNNVIAIEFDKNGKSINKSSLNIEDELEILEKIYKIKEKNVNFKILDKNKIILKTRKQIEDENFIKNELKNIDNKKLNYIFFECFGKQQTNKKDNIKKLLNLSKNSKEYKDLYNILKLTSTYTK